MDDFFTHWEAKIPTHFFQFKEERTNNKHIEEQIKLTTVHFNKDDMDNA
jgi:hypothetical protein